MHQGRAAAPRHLRGRVHPGEEAPGARCQVPGAAPLHIMHLQVGAKCWRLGAGRANWLDAAARCAAQAAVLASVTTSEEQTAVSSEHVTRVSSH